MLPSGLLHVCMPKTGPGVAVLIAGHFHPWFRDLHQHPGDPAGWMLCSWPFSIISLT
jgi:hypothetical protein